VPDGPIAASAQVIRICIPGVPRAWERAGHRLVRNAAGKQFIVSYTPNQTRAEQGSVKWFATRAMNGRPPLDGAIDLRIGAFVSVPRSWSKRKQADALAGTIYPTSRPDFDNYEKLATDALKGIVWRDDAQVVNAAFWKRYSTEPRVVVEVRLLYAAAATLFPTHLTKNGPAMNAGPEG
jgi:Holliday junction resolvase RusA-like endonuclease